MGLSDSITNPQKLISTVILVVVAVAVLVGLLPTLIASLGNLSTTGLPFASFFATGGIIYIVLGAVILLAGLGMIGLKMGKR